MSAAAAQVEAVDRVELTPAMHGMLLHIRHIGAGGYDGPRRDPTLCALERRGLIERRGTRARPDIHRFHATFAGCLHVDEEQRAVARFERQPGQVHVSPSKPSHWYGAAQPGTPVTSQQIAELDRRGKDWRRMELVEVKREATDQEMWTPIGQERKVYRFSCPVVGCCKNGRLAVISPSGDFQTIQPDGWVSPPKGVYYGREFG